MTAAPTSASEPIPLGTSSNANPSATGPSPTRRPAAPATLRGAARAAVEAAWDRARRRAPCRRSRRSPGHRRDRATGQRRARRSRHEPRPQARPAPADGARWDRDALADAIAGRRAACRAPIARSTVAAPGLRQPPAVGPGPRGPPVAAQRPTPRAGPGPRRPPPHVNVEFVSANPTGPLTVGNARGAFVGDLLCRVLEAVGHQVTREYYFNDSGAQVRKLGLSVLALRDGRPVPGGRLPRRLRRRAGRAGAATSCWQQAAPPRADRHGPLGRLGVGAESAPGSRPASSASASASTSGSPRARSTPRAGSSGRSTSCATAVTCTSRTARLGSARPPTATTRTGSSSASNGSQPTSPPTSAT